MGDPEEWWSTEYGLDIFQTFQIKEATLPEVKLQSPQLYLRRSLVDWLALVSSKFFLCETAFHLGVYLLDRFMDNHDIEEVRLHLVACGCLSVASKFEEKEARVPRLTDFRKICQDMFTLNEFLNVELMILKHFDWELCVPTAAHFVDCFMQVAVSDCDKLMGQPITDVEHIFGYVRNYVKYFLDVSLQDFQFSKFLPSMVAASCFASSRTCLSLTPVWSIAMHKRTKYTLDDMAHCIELMLLAFQKDQDANRLGIKRKAAGDDSGLDESISSSSDSAD